jgi:predicted esterase YcpF (UPF0227 family)
MVYDIRGTPNSADRHVLVTAQDRQEVTDDIELESLKREMQKLARHLEGVADEIPAEAVGAILTELLSGYTAAAIIDSYSLESETETEA